MKNKDLPECGNDEINPRPKEVDLIDREAALQATLAYRAQMLTLSQVQEILQVSRTKLYRLRNRKRDRLPQHHFDAMVRVNRGELEDWRIRQKS